MQYWNRCIEHLEAILPGRDFNTWVRPLQVVEEQGTIRLLAPNQFIVDRVRKEYLGLVETYLEELGTDTQVKVTIEIGSNRPNTGTTAAVLEPKAQSAGAERGLRKANGNINPDFTFDTFVQGKSNQIARAASMQVGGHPGTVYNPLFIYGGVGLGKTHLMHAIGNQILETNASAKVLYIHSEGFVAEMVKALQHNTIDEFKKRFRSLNALLIDDVQFFAGKERSQEEFFHTFNALFDSQQQIILTSDRFPKDVSGLEERLKSRFGWGLTVAIEPPDLETRVAILKRKAIQLFAIELPNDVAFFIGNRVRSNIRELEGALRRVVANAQFTGAKITTDFAREALKDLLAAHDKQVTIESIQKTVAEYFKLRTSDLTSAKRNRTVARPRQIAMALAKEMTNHSLPEIGAAFGGRDHTTVLYATRKVQELREGDSRIDEDYTNLLRTLSA